MPSSLAKALVYQVGVGKQSLLVGTNQPNFKFVNSEVKYNSSQCIFFDSYFNIPSLLSSWTKHLQNVKLSSKPRIKTQ